MPPGRNRSNIFRCRIRRSTNSLLVEFGYPPGSLSMIATASTWANGLNSLSRMRHHGVHGLRIGRIDASVAVEEMPLFKGHAGRMFVVGRHVRTEHDPDFHVEVAVRHVDDFLDLGQSRLVAGRQRVRHRLEHRPDLHHVVSQPVQPVQIASPVFERPRSGGVGMVVRPVLMHVHPDQRSGCRRLSAAVANTLRESINPVPAAAAEQRKSRRFMTTSPWFRVPNRGNPL